MNILWLTWKDDNHPTAGGAEVVLLELSRRLIHDGHAVTWLTCGYPNDDKVKNVEGLTIIRVGKNRYTHSPQALLYYARHLRNKFDIVIEVVNTAPYFSVFFGRKSQRFLFYHQLAGSVWLHETGIPINYIGRYVFEPIATRLLGRANIKTITVSESTRNDLVRFGFQHDRVHIISQGIQLEPIADLASIQKFHKPTMLSLGALRGMKRTLHQIEAFEIAKSKVRDLQLKIAGLADGPYGHTVLSRIRNSPFAADIEYLGKVTNQAKVSLMQRAHLITVTSVKEGWGLIVTEAASQGTPAVVYDVDGLRDSVRNQETGFVTASRPAALADGIVAALADQDTYERIRQSAWQWSRQMTFDNAYQDLKGVLEIA